MPKSSAIDTWSAAVLRTYARALRFMEDALRDCPDELWEASMWTVPGPEPEPLPNPDGSVDRDPEVQERLLQGGSAVWNVAYHALWHLDYDLTGGFVSWEPPEPFGDQEGGRVRTRTFTRDELLGYARWCWTRAQQTIASLTDESAATPLPANHRFRGQRYAEQIASIPLHVVEHASQVRQFITSAGVVPGGEGDYRARAEALRNAVVGASDEELAQWVQHFGGFEGLLGIVFETLAGRVPHNAEDAEIAFVHDDIGFMFRIAGGRGEVARLPSGDAPATFRSSPADFLRLIVGELAIDEATTGGRIVIEGDEGELWRLFRTLRIRALGA